MGQPQGKSLSKWANDPKYAKKTVITAPDFFTVQHACGRLKQERRIPFQPEHVPETVITDWWGEDEAALTISPRSLFVRK